MNQLLNFLYEKISLAFPVIVQGVPINMEIERRLEYRL